VPGLVFGCLGVALLWYVPYSFLRFKRTGAIRLSIRPAWTPLGGWQPLMSLFKIAAKAHNEEVRVSELRKPWAAYLFLVMCGLLAIILLIGAYSYLRYGHGLEIVAQTPRTAPSGSHENA